MDNEIMVFMNNPSVDGDASFQIRDRFYSLSKTNQRIANYLLEHPDSISAMTISQLARKVQASPASITRFCQIFGFSGFPEMKYHFFNNPSPFNTDNNHILPNESVSVVKNKINSLYLQAINEAVSLVDENLLQRAIRRIVAADKLVFFSQGGSGIAAQFAQVSFMQIGFACHCYNDMSISKLAASELTPRDVAVGISFSGMAKVPVDALRIAHERKSYTICVTGFSGSRITRYADISFCYNCKIDDDMRTMNIARICEIGILGLLHACILSQNYEHIHQKADSLKAATLQGRYEN